MMCYGWTLAEALELTMPQMAYFLGRMRDYPALDLAVAMFAHDARDGRKTDSGLAKVAAMSGGGFSDAGPLAEVLKIIKGAGKES